MSFKGGPSNDYVVGLQAAREGADVYLVDRVKGQWDFTETRRQVVRLHGRYPETQTTLIEEAANGPAIINVLTGQIAGIIPVRPDGGKYARAEAAAPMVEAGNVWLPDPQPHGRARPERAWVDEKLPAPALRVSDGRARRRRGCLLATHRALRQAAVGLGDLVADDFSTQVTCVMTHASYARQLTARTKTANVMGSDTIAVAVDRRNGPAFIEDRPYGRPIRSSPWPWPLTPSRRAASPATTASRSESHRQGGLDTVRQWAWERPWAAATHGGRGPRGWRKRHRASIRQA